MKGEEGRKDNFEKKKEGKGEGGGEGYWRWQKKGKK